MDKEFNIWLSINWDLIKEKQKEAKSKGLKTYGEVKDFIYRYFKNLGTTFEPSILILSCNSYKQYKELSSRVVGTISR